MLHTKTKYSRNTHITQLPIGVVYGAKGTETEKLYEFDIDLSYKK